MFNFLKSISPVKARVFARTVREKLYRLYDATQPYLIWRNYFGYKMYYTRGSGLVDRVRFGSTSKIYEGELVKEITTELLRHKNPLFVDIGTNIGLISLSVLGSAPGVTIVGFEPSPVAYMSFLVTIFANQIENKVKLINKAVDRANGVIKFSAHDERDSSGDGIIDTKRASSDGKSITVDAIKLDDWWIESGRPRINVIKIDIEGAELRAFEEAVLCLKETRPVIFLEISKQNLKVYPHNEKDILNFFHANGYNLYDLGGQLCNLENISSVVDSSDTFIARPE